MMALEVSGGDPDLAEYSRRVQCLGKEAMEREVAVRVARAMNARNRAARRQNKPREQGTVNAYECRFCGAWHVGTQR